MAMGLLRWWRGRRRQRERQIFRFWDGTTTRGIDPIAVYRSFAEHPTFDAAKHPALCVSDDPKIAADAMRHTMNAMQAAFGLRAYAESAGHACGLTDIETLEVLQAFNAYMESLKKTTKLTPISPAATERDSSARSTMPPMSDYGSTADGRKTVAQPAC